MTLTFHEIGLRWPDAVVYWDRDVSPTLDWEPRFRLRGETLWADCVRDHWHLMRAEFKAHQSVPPGEWREQCRCRVWEPTLKEWWTHERWNRMRRTTQEWKREHIGQWIEPQRPFHERVREGVGMILNRSDLELDAYGPMIRAIEEPRGDLYPDDRSVRRAVFRMAERILRMEGRDVPWSIAAGAHGVDW